MDPIVLILDHILQVPHSTSSENTEKNPHSHVDSIALRVLRIMRVIISVFK